MKVWDLAQAGDSTRIGREMYECIEDLYPLCRSITGEGLRETLRRLARLAPLTIQEVPTGTPVFDWTVPREWNIRDAYVKNSRGQRVIDFRESNLHVVHYSVPIHTRMPLAELRPHLFTLPGHPDWIPYRTSYHEERWGFCLSHRRLLDLEEEEYEVCIDATLGPGSLSYGELLLEGETSDEVLIACHVCHPSLANDNLAGVALAIQLARELAGVSRRYSYRFLFLPGTIGAIAWLSLNEPNLRRIKHGLVLTCAGDAGSVTYKKTRRGDAAIDRAFTRTLQEQGDEHTVLGFSPYGDERQFCSPGLDLPMGCLTRTAHGGYPEYHTSADDLALVHPWALADTFGKCLAALGILEGDRTYLSLNPKCEPHLGKRGLYRRALERGPAPDSQAMLWILSFTDGHHSLLDIAERSGLPFQSIRAAADALAAHGLLEEQGVIAPVPAPVNSRGARDGSRLPR